MRGPRTTSALWWLLIAAVAGPALVLLVPLPKGSRLLGVFLNLGHVVLGAAVFVLLWAVLRQVWRRTRWAPGAVAWLGAVSLLGAMEVFQAFSKTRTPTLGDVVGNGLGATAALCFTAFGRRLVRRVAAAAVPLAIAAVPAGLEAWDTVRQRAAFPVLSDFETQLEMTRWSFREARGVRVRDAHRGAYALDVSYQVADWPAVQFPYVSPDWRGYDTLSFAVHTQTDVVVHLLVVDGQYNQRWDDAFHKKLTLRAGWQIVRVALSDIARGPATRSLNLGDVHSVQWYADHPKEPFSIRLDAIELRR